MVQSLLQQMRYLQIGETCPSCLGYCVSGSAFSAGKEEVIVNRLEFLLGIWIHGPGTVWETVLLEEYRTTLQTLFFSIHNLASFESPHTQVQGLRRCRRSSASPSLRVDSLRWSTIEVKCAGPYRSLSV